jgi:two-component system chemotaxis response regulator CheY
MRRCLIVDDSSVVRRVAIHILESLNYVVSEAENGEEAARQCQVLMPDIIILDWHMPGPSAFDTIAAIRAIENERRPYIVYLTTEYDTLTIARAISAGANDFLMKPFDRESLAQKFTEIATALAA